jgi:glycosyltransferase involved in cell wall biosynthesis
MNIWIINHYGKYENRHFFIGKHLVRRGHKVTICSSSFDHDLRQEIHLRPGQLHDFEDVDGVRFVWIKTPPYSGNGIRRVWNMLYFSFKIISSKALRNYADYPEVIIGSSPHLFAAMSALLLSHSYRVPFVMEVRDLWPDSLTDLGGISKNHPAIKIMSWMESYLYKKSKFIITLLPRAQEYIARFTNGQKVHWVPNGVETGIVPEPKRKSDDNIFRVMYAGAHGVANSLDTVLDAAKLIEKTEFGGFVQFVLIGDGPEKNRLINRVKSEKIKCVEFLPKVPRYEVYNVMQTADALLVILKDAPVFGWGVSPNKLFDYMITARPVIYAVNSPYNPVENANAGISLSAQNPVALAEAVLKMASLTAEERWQMGLRGRKYVMDNNDYARLADHIEEILVNAIDKSDMHSTIESEN